MNEGFVAYTKENISLFRLAALKSALKLEIAGMKRGGRSVYSIIKEEFGLRGNKRTVLADFEKLIEQKKNVHAFVRGYLCSPREADYTPAFSWDYVKYNPYKSDSFVSDNSPVSDNIKVKKAKFVDMDVTDKHGVLAWGST